MVNALELLTNFQNSQSARENQRTLADLAQRKFAAEQQMMPGRMEEQRLSNLAKLTQLQNYGPELERKRQAEMRAEQLARDTLAARERMAGQSRRGGAGGTRGTGSGAGGTGAPKPTWDAARGVFIVPPTPENPQGTVIQPQGLPKTGQERKFESDEEKEKSRFESAIKKADLIIGTAGEALQQAGPATTGLLGDIRRTNAGRMTGSGAYDLAKTIDTIKANLGFQELQAMREASPTGGALGAIAVQELVALQSTLASLDAGQSEDQLKRNLRKVQDHYRNWKTAVEKARGGAPAGAPAAGGLSGQDAEAMAWANANPNDPRAAEIKRRLGR